MVVGRPEATAEAVSEGVEVPTEITPGTVDRFANGSPEIFQRSDLLAVQHICRCHGPEDTFRSAPCLSDSGLLLTVRKSASDLTQLLARALQDRRQVVVEHLHVHLPRVLKAPAGARTANTQQETSR
ncbi:hypothetical protein [Streptomyces canarius]